MPGGPSQRCRPWCGDWGQSFEVLGAPLVPGDCPPITRPDPFIFFLFLSISTSSWTHSLPFEARGAVPCPGAGGGLGLEVGGCCTIQRPPGKSKKHGKFALKLTRTIDHRLDINLKAPPGTTSWEGNGVAGTDIHTVTLNNNVCQCSTCGSLT